jgi:pilus assembly protein CpaB
MVGIAVVVGGVTVVAARFMLDRGASRPAVVAEVKPAAAVEMTTVLVAAEALRFGVEVTQPRLKEIPWPASAVPTGAYRTIADFMKEAPQRMALAAIEENEPILPAKVTGPGQRAILSATLREGMKAVTIGLSETQGLAGLVMPGDHVDVLITRQPPREGVGSSDKADGHTDVLLQNVRVLAVDQVIDERTAKPLNIKSATLELSLRDSQRAVLGATLGTLSMVLRRAGESQRIAASRAGARDLEGSDDDLSTATQGKRNATVRVMRGATPQDYAVPADGRR